MIRFILRLLSTVALSIAVIFGVLDSARSVAASAPVLTPLADSWASGSPMTLAVMRETLQGLWAPLWDPVATTILAMPGFAVFLAIAFLLFLAGRRPPRRVGRFTLEE